MGSISSTEKKIHWHLKGNWAPVEEELNVDDLEVKGEIPKDLSGSVSYTHLTLPTK